MLEIQISFRLFIDIHDDIGSHGSWSRSDAGSYTTLFSSSFDSSKV